MRFFPDQAHPVAAIVDDATGASRAIANVTLESPSRS